MVVVMRRYAKGEQVEVKNGKGALENLWHPARVIGGHGNEYNVLYDWRVNGVEAEKVLVERIRPCPPVVEFSKWSRGDVVQVYDSFAWKLATVMEVFEVLVGKKQLLVRVVGSMEDLVVSAARARVRHHYDWRHDTWTVVGKSQAKQWNSARKNEKNDDSGSSSSGSCSINSDCSSNLHYLDEGDDVSDAESCTGPIPTLLVS